MPMYIPLDAYLAIQTRMSAEDNPFTNLAKSDPSYEALGKAFTAHSNALGEFVRLAREHPKFGYKRARDMLEAQVHMFIPPDYDVYIPDDLSGLDDLKGQALGDDNPE